MTRSRTAPHPQAGPLAARLAVLARVNWTGALHLDGETGGSIYLSDGTVSYASSNRTPAPAAWPGSPPTRPGEDGVRPAGTQADWPGDDVASAGGASGVGGSGGTGGVASAGRMASAEGVRISGGAGDAGGVSGAGGVGGALAWGLVLAEATVDAAIELLAGGGRRGLHLRVEEGVTPQVGAVAGLLVAELLAEVDRRMKILKRLSKVVTADTVVARNPELGLHRVRISALQWALLIRAGGRATPRSLAFDLSRSVSGTTMEVYRLIAMELASPVGQPSSPSGGTGGRLAGVSFLRAVAR